MITHPNLTRNTPQTKKQRLFRVFHILVTEYNISHYFYSALLVIQMFQLLYFPIHYSCCDIWSFTGIAVIQQIFGFLQGSLVWQFSTNFVLLLFNCIVCIVYGIAAVDIVYEVGHATPDTLSARDNFQQLRIKYLQYLSTLSRQILQILLISLTTTSIKNSIKMSTPQQTWLLIVSIVTFLVYFSINILFLQLFIDNSPFTKFSLAWSINNNQKYKNILKYVIGISGSLLPSQCDPSANSTAQIVHLILLVIIFVGFLYLSYLNYFQPNLIHNSVRFIYEHSTITVTSMYFMVILQKLISPKQNVTLLFLFIFCFMMNFAWSQLKQHREESLIFRIYKSLTTKNQILSYNYLMCQYIRDFSQDPLCLIKLQGILSDHIFTCKKVDTACKCRTIREQIRKFEYNSDVSKVREQKKLWFQFLKQNLQYNTQKMNHLPEFHLLLSYIEKNMLNNSFVSYTNLQKCSKKIKSLSVQFLIYHQKRIIQNTLIEQDIRFNEKKQVDVNKFLAMSDQIQIFQQKVLMSSLEHLEYWKKFSGTHKKSKSTIMKQGSNLLKAVKQCEQYYSKIHEKYPTNLQSIVLFSNYSKYILNNHELILKNKGIFNMIKKKLCRAIKISPEQQKQKYSQNSVTGSIIISGQKHNVGTIKTCSSKITKILKYAPYELVGQNINTLMPNFIGNMHNEVLCKYLELSDPQSNFVQRYVPMKDKNNFLVLGRIMTKPLPSLLNGLQLIGLLEKVRQGHIRHHNQVPKYALYRCDTGNIEALSQNFFTHFGYRLMKVNQYSQISEELLFGNIFQDVCDRDLVNCEEGFQCQIKPRNGSKKKVRVKAYIRSQFYYFGVKIRLIYLFSCSPSNLLMNNAVTINVGHTNLALSEKSSSSASQNTPKSLEGIPKSSNQTLTQQELKQLQNRTPLKLRIFQFLLLIFGILIISIAIVQFYFDLDKVSVMQSFHEHNQYTSNSLLYLINVGYYARLMHLSANHPSKVLNFDEFKSNVSQYTNNLQKAEFWLVNKEVEYNNKINFSFNSSALSWQINEKSAIFSTSSSLSLSIFDLVTSSSSFDSATKNSFNFALNLTSDNSSGKTNSYFRNLFRIRYSSLFELITLKEQYSNEISSAYQNKLSSYITYGNVIIGLTCFFILLFLVVKIRIVYIILNSIFGITTLFNWLTPSQIDKQVHKCENFLQHFFNHYYEVVLRLKKNEMLSNYSFAEERSDANKNNNRFMKTMTYQAQENDEEKKEQQNEVEIQSKNNLMQQCLENDEIDLQKVSNKYIKINEVFRNKDGINMEQKTPLTQQQEMEQISFDSNDEEQGFCFENISAFIPIILGYVFLFSHFLAIFLADQISLVQGQQISTQSFIYKNIYVLDMLKYYGMENAVDRTKFKNYRDLNSYLTAYSLEIYQLQKDMSTFTNVKNYTSQIMKIVENLNNNGVCIGDFTPTLSYLSSSFNANQCKSIDQGILDQGLRASIVAYIENVNNLTNITDANLLLTSDSFTRILQLDKYIKSAMHEIVAASISTSQANLQNEKKIKITQFSFFICLAVIVIFLVNWRTSVDLKTRIQGTYQIITLIPQRIFQKNTNLCAEYRKNVSKLLQ